MTPPTDTQAKISEELKCLLVERGLTPQDIQTHPDEAEYRNMLSKRAKRVHQFRSQAGGRS